MHGRGGSESALTVARSKDMDLTDVGDAGVELVTLNIGTLVAGIPIATKINHKL